MKDTLIFEGIPSGDYEDACFAVTPKMYELITGVPPVLVEDVFRECGITSKPEYTYVDENPFHPGMLNIYLIDINKSDKFKIHIGKLAKELTSGSKEMVRIEFS